MAETIHVLNQQVIVNGSMAGNLTSTLVNLFETRNVCAQAIWSAGSTPTGTIFLQVSNDGTDWTNYDVGQAVSGATGSVFWNVVNAGFAFCQVIYTRSGGSGTLNVYVNGKQ